MSSNPIIFNRSRIRVETLGTDGFQGILPEPVFGLVLPPLFPPPPPLPGEEVEGLGVVPVFGLGVLAAVGGAGFTGSGFGGSGIGAGV